MDGTVFTALIDAVIVILWCAFIVWLGLKIVDDVGAWTKFSKSIVKAAIGTVKKQKDDYGRTVKVEHVRPKLAPQDTQLAGQIAIALAIVLGLAIVGTGIFFGDLVIAINGIHEDGWSLF